MFSSSLHGQSYRANKYVASQDLRGSLEYSAFAGEGKQDGSSTLREGNQHHSGWLLKRYGDGPTVEWKRRWFYLLDDRLYVTPTRHILALAWL